MHIKSLQLCQTFWGPHQAPLSMGFSRQESWSGLPFPSPKHTHTHICIYTHIIIYCYIYTYLLLESSLYITSFPLSVLPPCPLAQMLLSALFLVYIYILRRPGAVINLLPKSVSTHRSQTLVSKYFLHEKEQKLHWKTAGYKLGQEMVKGMTKWFGIYSCAKNNEVRKKTCDISKEEPVHGSWRVGHYLVTEQQISKECRNQPEGASSRQIWNNISTKRKNHDTNRL